MQAYMKSAMPYLGVQTQGMRAACAEVFTAYSLSSSEDWQQTIRALWQQAQYREERYAALALLGDRRYKHYRTLDVVPLYEELIVSGAWWDLVDGIATHLVGDLLRSYPDEMPPILRRWSTGQDHWLRRTSIICQVSFKRDTDRALLFDCIEPSIGERDFFLRKAIGWALREYGKHAPDIVGAYVASNEQRLSPLSKREALKYVK